MNYSAAGLLPIMVMAATTIHIGRAGDKGEETSMKAVIIYDSLYYNDQGI